LRIAALLFANIITSLEVYLLDTFANAVFRDEAFLRRFVESHPNFQKRQVKYSDIFKLHDDLASSVKRELAAVLWHNLPRVSKMFRATLDVEFGDFADLGRAVTVRHDIVHRNGRTTAGERIAIGVDEVRKVVALVQTLVDSVEKQVNENLHGGEQPGDPF
jgi:hypothetical protein